MLGLQLKTWTTVIQEVAVDPWTQHAPGITNSSLFYISENDLDPVHAR